MNILATLRNAWNTADLRKKILFTLFIIVLFRLGTAIPVPGITATTVSQLFGTSSGLLGYFDMLSGGALSQGRVFALSIQPYINASIIIQLLTVAFPKLQDMQQNGGEEGKRKIRAITRYSTVAIAVIQALGYQMLLSENGYLTHSFNLFSGKWDTMGFLTMLVIVFTLVAGASLVVWLGECIDESGIGNGISIILFAGIVSRGWDLVENMITFRSIWWMSLIEVVLFLVIIVAIVFMDAAERRIPIQYAKRQIGRKVYGGQNTFLPIKVAMTGVMPIIFAFAIVNVPATIAQFFAHGDNGTYNFYDWVQDYFSPTSVLYMIVTFVLIIFFNYFYLSIQYDPVEISNNIKNNGGTIPGIRPGKPTSDFIIRCVHRVTLCGALFLGVVAILPYIVQGICSLCCPYDISVITGTPGVNADLNSIIGYWTTEANAPADFFNYTVQAAASGFAVGGTSLMILVSVALETVRGLESQMLMRHYKGFLD